MSDNIIEHISNETDKQNVIVNVVENEQTNIDSFIKDVNYNYCDIIHISKPVEWNCIINNLSDYLILIKFTASWCGPCKTIHPYFEELAKQDNIICIEVDVDNAEEIVEVCEIKSVPSFHFIYEKKLLNESNSANKQNLINTFQNCLTYIKK
jgi:thioredoxin 1